MPFSIPNKYRHMLLMLIATDTGQKLRSTLETCVVFALIMLLTSLAAGSLGAQINRAYVAESFSLVSTIRADLMAYRAETGRWPDDAVASGSSALLDGELGKYVRQIRLRNNGELDVVLRSDGIPETLANRHLTIRFGQAAHENGSPYIFSCASRAPPPGIVSFGLDTSTISAEYLPQICRGQ